MLTINDLRDQFEIQGYVTVKEIDKDGNVNPIVGGSISSVYSKYTEMEIAYMYVEDGELVIEVKEED